MGTAVRQHLTGNELAVCWSGLTGEGRQTCEEEKQGGTRSGTPWELLHGAREHKPLPQLPGRDKFARVCAQKAAE